MGDELYGDYTPTFKMPELNIDVSSIGSRLPNGDLSFEQSGWEKFTGSALSKGGPDGKQGWASPVISGLTGAASAYLGYQQMKLGKSQLEQNKKIFNLNFSNQAQSINTQLEDRQRSRVAGSAGGSSQAESVESYMAKNAIKSKGI